MFTAGKNYLLAGGLPTTCYFDLSTKSVDSTSPFAAGDVMASGAGIITGTGYTEKSQSEPTPSGGSAVFALMSWATGSATDWQQPRSLILKTATGTGGTMICAWNLQVGGAARALNAANVTENVTPTLSM
jgi:hypothetical protein